MYLTHMPLNVDRRTTRELVASPQRLHAGVLSGFVPGSVDTGRVLWRLDSPERHRLDLYVVSPIEPSFEALVEQAGWSNQPTWRSTDYQRFLDRLEMNQEWIFRLRANPVVSVREEGRSRGKRIPLTALTDQQRWLIDRAPGWGFQISLQCDGLPNLTVTDRSRERFAKGHRDDRRTVTVASAVFTGVLQVTDPVALADALISGMGPAKGYGCGLMTLARSSR